MDIIITLHWKLIIAIKFLFNLIKSNSELMTNFNNYYIFVFFIFFKSFSYEISF